MRNITQGMIKTYFIYGLIYGGLLVGDDYLEGNGFRVWRFIVSTSFFGLLMVFLFRYNLKKNESSKEEKN